MSKKIYIHKNTILVVCENEQESKLLALDLVFNSNEIDEYDGKPNTVKLDQTSEQIYDIINSL